MRIGIDARSIGPLETGPGIYARSLIDRISRLAPEWTFFLYWARSAPGIRLPGRTNVIARELGRPGGRKLGNLIFEQGLLPAALRRDGCELLWSPAFILPVRKETLQVVTMHDVIPLVFARSSSPARRAVYNRILRLNARRADRILTVSQSSADDLVRHLGVARRRIRVVPNGIEREFKPLALDGEPSLASLLLRLGVGAPYILVTAGLLPRKNIHRVLEGFAAVAGSGRTLSTASLVITGRIGAGGNGPYVGELRGRARALGLEERVRFAGFVDRASVRLLYCGALCSIDASLYEGFGFPVAESMACGCPVIVSNRSSLPEVAGDGGLLVDPESIEEIAGAMERLALDGDLRRTLIGRGIVRARRFCWDEAARRTLDVLREALEPAVEPEAAPEGAAA